VAQIQVTQHDHAVEPQICRFANYCRRIAARLGVACRENGFYRLFTNFFKYLVQTLLMQAGNIRGAGLRLFALGQYVGQLRQDVRVGVMSVLFIFGCFVGLFTSLRALYIADGSIHR